MGAIKRNITDISNIKRGAVQMSAVYRGADLIWPSTPTTVTKWLTSGLNMFLDETVTTKYVTSGLNKNLK